MHNTSLIIVNKTTGSLNLDEVYSRKSVKLYIKNSILKKNLKSPFPRKMIPNQINSPSKVYSYIWIMLLWTNFGFDQKWYNGAIL